MDGGIIFPHIVAKFTSKNTFKKVSTYLALHGMICYLLHFALGFERNRPWNSCYFLEDQVRQRKTSCNVQPGQQSSKNNPIRLDNFQDDLATGFENMISCWRNESLRKWLKKNRFLWRKVNLVWRGCKITNFSRGFEANVWRVGVCVISDKEYISGRFLRTWLVSTKRINHWRIFSSSLSKLNALNSTSEKSLIMKLECFIKAFRLSLPRRRS